MIFPPRTIVCAHDAPAPLVDQAAWKYRGRGEIKLQVRNTGAVSAFIAQRNTDPALLAITSLVIPADGQWYPFELPWPAGASFMTANATTTTLDVNVQSVESLGLTWVKR